MARKRIFITGLSVALVLLVLSAIFYIGYKYIFYATVPAETAIPQNALAVVKINEPANLYGSLKNENKVWRDLSGLPVISALRKNLDSLHSIIAGAGMSETLNTPLYAVVTQAADSVQGFVYILEMPGRKEEERWIDILQKYNPHERARLRFSITGPQIEVVKDKDGTGKWFYSITKGLLIASQQSELVDQFTSLAGKKGSLGDNADYRKVRETAGKKVDANVFFNYRFVSSFLTGISPEMGLDAQALVSKFASWTGLDLILRNDEVLLTGYTTASKDKTFLSYFDDQKPARIEMIGTLPFNTASIFWIGKSDPSSFTGPGRKDFLSYGGALLECPVPDISTSEMARVTTWQTSGKAAATYIILRKDGNASLKNYLQGNSTPAPQAAYKEHPVRKTGTANSKSLFSISGKYYSEISDYYVFTDDLGALQSYINTLESGKTLDIGENFKVFSDNISEKGNVFFYLNVRHSLGKAGEYLKEEYATQVSQAGARLENLQGLAFQFSKLNGMFFTSLYLRHNENYREEDLSVWKAELNARISTQPYLVVDHRAEKLKIVAFDEENRMYLIDNYGNILWQLELVEKPLSQVYQVDYYKNGKIQYLFNTENYLYLVDLLGRTVDNYPIKLNQKATGSMAVFDYNDKRDYRLLIPCEDKVTYNYDIKGTRIKGWVNPKLPRISTLPAQHLVVGRKDYIILRDIQNNILISDRKGRRRITLKEELDKAPNSLFYVNKTNSKGILITTNSKGHLTYIDDNGRLQYTVFGDFAPDHYFLYEDFDNNGHRDFIFLDMNRLVIFDRFKKLIFEYTFPENITSAPKVFENSDGKKLIGVVLAGASKLYLFDSDGEATITSGLFAETPFTVGSLERNGILNLVAGADRIIYNYVIE